MVNAKARDRNKSRRATTFPAIGAGAGKGFADAEEEADRHQRREVPGQSGHGGQCAPSDDDQGQNRTRPEPVGEPPGRNLRQCVAERKRSEDHAHGGVGQGEVVRDRLLGRGDAGAVDEGDHRQNEEPDYHQVPHQDLPKT